jgi:aquaporin Z
MNKYIVEFLGTALLCFVVFATGNYLAIGAALAIAVFLGGKISGGAFNPAVALGMMVNKKINAQQLLFYVVAELLGGLTGLSLSRLIK